MFGLCTSELRAVHCMVNNYIVTGLVLLAKIKLIEADTEVGVALAYWPKNFCFSTVIFFKIYHVCLKLEVK